MADIREIQVHMCAIGMGSAQRLPDTLGLRVIQTDVGGECGRQLLIDCQQHTFVVKKIARPQ